jgi:hypothetical protein
MTSTAEPAPPVFAGVRDRLVRRLGDASPMVCGIAATVDAVAVVRAVDTARATAPKYPQLM